MAQERAFVQVPGSWRCGRKESVVPIIGGPVAEHLRAPRVRQRPETSGQPDNPNGWAPLAAIRLCRRTTSAGDPGAADAARRLSTHFDASLVLSGCSRLVIDRHATRNPLPNEVPARTSRATTLCRPTKGQSASMLCFGRATAPSAGCSMAIPTDRRCCLAFIVSRRSSTVSGAPGSPDALPPRPAGRAGPNDWFWNRPCPHSTDTLRKW